MVVVISTVDIVNCRQISAIRSLRPFTEPANRPLAASDGLNEVIYHAGYSATTMAITTPMARIMPIAVRLSKGLSEQVTYPVSGKSINATAR